VLDSDPAFEVHLAVETGMHEGRPCRKYRGFDAATRPLFEARARRAPGPIHVFPPGSPMTPTLSMEPRRSFPLTGQYDVRRAADRRVLGVVRRNGKLSDAAGNPLARFKDARSLRGFIGEGLCEMAFQAALGGGGSVDAGTGSGTFVLLVDGEPAGSLRRGRLPFLVASPPIELAGWQRWIRRALPRSWYEPRPPSGWKLTAAAAAGHLDRELLVAQALLTAEISAW
jgi:hypothetical protein